MKLYALCPNAVTGGPEDLHQLVHTARELGYDAHVVYERPTLEVPGEYAGYDVAPALEAPDDPDHVIVIPEKRPQWLHLYPRSQRVFWWLSWGKRHPDAEKTIARTDVVHACECLYTYKQLRSRGCRTAVLLIDYINDDFLAPPAPAEAREDLVFYNPRKGIRWTRQLMAFARDLEFVPLQGYSRKQLIEVLNRGKVYLDLGYAPGKDHLPREAAMANLCVITSRTGAFENVVDTPILDEYRFALPRLRLGPLQGLLHPTFRGVRRKLRQCLAEYEERVHDFELLRDRVRAEKAIFRRELASLLAALSQRRVEQAPGPLYRG